MAEDRFAHPAQKFKSLVGRKFGRLLVVGFAGKQGKNTRWHCDCECGLAVIRRADHLQAGRTASCGCLNRDVQRANFMKHGGARSGDRHPLYGVWCGMIKRCENPKFHAFQHYGGRGIKVCEEWRGDFARFVADMGARPAGHSIDRIDPNGNYEPSNCRWADALTQNRNRRNVKAAV